MTRTLTEIVDQIMMECVFDDMNHLICFKKKSRKGFNGIHFHKKTVSKAKCLYAFHYECDVSDIGVLQRICCEPKCISPSHHVRVSDLKNDGSTPDENGWNESRRRKIEGQLGLLDQEYGKECIYHPGWKESDTYRNVNISGVCHTAHVISLRLKLRRPLLKGMDASHTCHNKACCNPEHLVEENRSQNILRSRNDEQFPHVKLSEKQVLDIFHCQDTYTTISERYSIAIMTISDIKTGRAWSDITGKGKVNPKKVTREDFIITKEHLQELQLRLERETTQLPLSEDEQKQPHFNGPHWIPNSKFRSKQGYGSTTFKKHGVYWHQIAAIVKYHMTRFPNTKKFPNEHVRHKCMKKDCCNPDHIEFGTHKDNQQDKIRDGTNVKPKRKCPFT